MKGKLLIATPELLTDSIFSQSVILIVDDHEEGTVGFILNKPLPVLVKEVTDINSSLQIYDGGPVSIDQMYFLHNAPEIIPGGQQVYDNLFWGGDIRVVKEIFDDNESLLQDRIKFFIGYSGWGKEQLENEINEGAWLVSEKKLDIFKINPKNLWKKLLVEVDPAMELWKNAPQNPELN